MDGDRDDRKREGRFAAIAIAAVIESPRGPDGYVRWEYAGGPDECVHGYAAGIPCPRCEARARQDDADMRTLDGEVGSDA